MERYPPTSASRSWSWSSLPEVISSTVSTCALLALGSVAAALIGRLRVFGGKSLHLRPMPGALCRCGGARRALFRSELKPTWWFAIEVGQRSGRCLMIWNWPIENSPFSDRHSPMPAPRRRGWLLPGAAIQHTRRCTSSRSLAISYIPDRLTSLRLTPVTWDNARAP